MSDKFDWEEFKEEGQFDWDQFPEGVNDPSVTESALRGAGQGATLGFSDELLASGRAIYDDVKSVFTGENQKNDLRRDEQGRVVEEDAMRSEAYDKLLEQERKLNTEAQQANPGAYVAGQVAGAVLSSALPVVGGAKLSNMVAQGALYSAGASEADNILDLAKDTAKGALTGAAIGAAGSAVSKGLGAAGAAIKNTIEDVATAPMSSGGRMGLTASGISKIGKYGDKFDEVFKKISKSFTGTGNEAADKILEQLVKKGSFAIPGVGKFIALADFASQLPKITQNMSIMTSKGVEKLSPFMGKYKPILEKAAKKSANALVNTNNALQMTDKNYIDQLQEAQVLLEAQNKRDLEKNMVTTINSGFRNNLSSGKKIGQKILDKNGWAQDLVKASSKINNKPQQGQQFTSKQYSSLLGASLGKDDSSDILEYYSNKPIDKLQEIQDRLSQAAKDVVNSKDPVRVDNFVNSMTYLIGRDFAEGILKNPEAFREAPDESILQDLDAASESMVIEHGVKNLFNDKSVGLDNPIKTAQDDMISMNKKMNKPEKAKDPLETLVGKGTVREQYQRMLDKVANMEANVSKTAEEMSNNESGAPTLTAQYNLQLLQTIKYINDIIPKQPAPNLLYQREYVPNDQDMNKFRDQLKVVVDPTSVLANIESGNVSQAQIQALEDLYPSMLNIMRQRIINKLATKPKKMNYSERLRVSKLLGIEGDVALSPTLLQRLQQSYQQGGQQPSQVTTVARPAQFDVPNLAGGAEGLLKAK